MRVINYQMYPIPQFVSSDTPREAFKYALYMYSLTYPSMEVETDWFFNSWFCSMVNDHEFHIFNEEGIEVFCQYSSSLDEFTEELWRK